MSENPLPQNNNTQTNSGLVVASYIIGVIFLAILFSAPNLPFFKCPPSNFIAKVLLALGAGGVAAGLTGTITTISRGITAAGGLAVFVLILFIPIDSDDLYKPEQFPLCPPVKGETTEEKKGNDSSEKSETTEGEEQPNTPERPKEKITPDPPDEDDTLAPLSGELKDKDGNKYVWVQMKDGNKWMTENLNSDVGEGSWFYNDNPENGKKYGRLYTWEAAKRACPPGWRLPTKDEWEDFATLYGGYSQNINGKWVDEEKSREAYKNLISSGNSYFNAQFGGRKGPQGTFQSLKYFGHYWTISKDPLDNNSAYFFYFAGTNSTLVEQVSSIDWARSVRCIKD
jgi:uncharacterized protein (TIGR02145 family)